MVATTLNVFRKTVFYKQILEIHHPSIFYARHPGIKITGPYCISLLRGVDALRTVYYAECRLNLIERSIFSKNFKFRARP
jgi:hypothetical protein